MTTPRRAPSRALQIAVFWGDSIVHTASSCPPAPFALGGAASHDGAFALPAELLGGERRALVSVSAGAVSIEPPPGARTRVAGEVVAGGAALPLGASAEIELAGFRIRIEHAERAARCTGRVLRPGRGLLASALSGAAHAGLLAALAAFMPPTSGLADDEVTEDQRITMRHYLESAAERELESAREAFDGSPDGSVAGDDVGRRDRPGRAAEVRTACGNVPCTTSTAPTQRVSVTDRTPGAEEPGRESDPRSREQLLEAARTSAMIELVAQQGPAADLDWTLPNGPSAADPAFFPPAGDDFRTMDLLSDPRLEGDFKLLDHVRTLSEDDDALRKARCRGRDCFGGLPRRRDHRPEGPTFREVAKPDQGGGTLPSELIQRVVHASFGRFRACYQTGLLQNPSLAGRVVVRFLIGRDGRVMSAADGGSDLPDRGVVSCIASSFQALTFPAPERGTVTVTYPFALTPPQ